MNRDKLYALLFIACLAGYVWLSLSVCLGVQESGSLKFCLFKAMFNIPCPACGTTRGIALLLHGQFYGALLMNPFSYLVFVIMLVSPLWVLYDIIRRKQSLFHSYQLIETYLRKRYLAVPLVLLIAANWAWNIFKGV